jgi:signal transduction histidine kinase
LHDDMGSTLSTINILSSMAKAKIATDTIKTSEYINKISDNSQRMMEAMDDIVWAIKPANDTMQKIVARMREFATSVLEAKEMDLEFTVDETVQDVALDMEQRRDLFLLFKEAVNNVAKYSKCKKAGIALLVKDKKLQLVVADDGVGFDTKKADSGNGLGNMLKRADALRGRVEITSKPGNGTEVKLTVPL